MLTNLKLIERNKSFFERIDHSLRAMRQMQLAQNIPDVSFDRLFADEQGFGDLTVRAAVRELPQNFYLSFGQFAARQTAARHLLQHCRSYRRINH